MTMMMLLLSGLLFLTLLLTVGRSGSGSGGSVSAFSVSTLSTYDSRSSSRNNNLPMSMSMSNMESSSSSSSSAYSIMSSDLNNLDRFKVVCLDGSYNQEYKRNVLQEFGDSSLVVSLDDTDIDDDIWVAVYRSNNNKLSVVVRDDFFRAMNDATTQSDDYNDNDNDKDGNNTGGDSSDNNNNNNNNNLSTISPSFVSPNTSSLSPLLEVPKTKPVAVARLCKSTLFSTSSTTTATTTNNNSNGDVYIIDNLRCSLKKEDQNACCDGGSEYLEALACAVDTLLLRHLQEQHSTTTDVMDENHSNNDIVFEGTIRTKATLYNSKLFEQRGFIPVETLSRDMATHISNYESCFSCYAERSIGKLPKITNDNDDDSDDVNEHDDVSSAGKGFNKKSSDNDTDDKASSSSNSKSTSTTINRNMATGTRDRALQIVSLLGRLDPEVQRKAKEDSDNDNNDDDDDNGYDPWANVNLGFTSV